MKQLRLIGKVILGPIAAIAFYFLPTAHLGRLFGLESLLFFSTLTVFIFTAAHWGMDKIQKGRIFFWGGLAVLGCALLLISQLIKLSPQIVDNIEKLKMDNTRANFLILASVFGVSSMARGVQYWADGDLERKKMANQSPDPALSSGTPPAGQESRHP
jgi:hypothetical protein